LNDVREKINMEYKLVDLFDFTDGVPIDRSKIKEWHEKILQQLKEDKSEFNFISSGNSLVFGCKNSDIGRITIFVFTKGYVKYSYMLEDKI
jgi:hypothetical protein